MVDQLCILMQIPDCAFLDHWIFLVSMLMSSFALFLLSKKAHLNSGARLLLELYCDVVIKHVAFLTIYAKLLATLAVIFTCLDVIIVLDLKRNIG